MLDNNEFGKLVRAYRKQREWTQYQLAERWEHSQAYVSQVEKGQRKVDSTAQLVKLAEILDIPLEKLEAIGRNIPQLSNKNKIIEIGDTVLQMLLTHGQNTIPMAWIAWVADQHPTIEGSLRELSVNLEKALIAYHGEFSQPALILLSHAHIMLGKMAFDRLDYAAASGHFGEAIILGKECKNTNIITVAMVQQADLLRKRGRYESALSLFKNTLDLAHSSSQGLQTMRHIFMARAFYCFGDEQNFIRSMNQALELAYDSQESLDNLANRVTVMDTLEEQAAGWTSLNRPEKAMEIYSGMEKVFRPLRNQGSYLIDKAQTYFHLGEFTRGIKLAEQGVALASSYKSKRHIARLQTTYSRLRETSIGKDKRLRTLQDLILQIDQRSW